MRSGTCGWVGVGACGLGGQPGVLSVGKAGQAHVGTSACGAATCVSVVVCGGVEGRNTPHSSFPPSTTTGATIESVGDEQKRV